MLFSIAIYAAPHSSQASASALKFAHAVLNSGIHKIYRIFFYVDGVHNATALASPPQDEIDLVSQWQIFAKTHNVDLVVCIAAALRRGVLDAKEAERYGKSASNLVDGFTISGLGQLLDAAVTSDRLITFGS